MEAGTGASGELTTEPFIDFAVAATEAFNSADNPLRGGLSRSIEGLIMKTHSWRDALLNIGTTITGALVQSFSQMAANWIAERVRMFVMGESLKKAETTSTVTEEAIKQAAMTPTAMLTSISSWGAAALIGAAVLTAVLASMGGFATGGYTGQGALRTGWVQSNVTPPVASPTTTQSSQVNIAVTGTRKTTCAVFSKPLKAKPSFLTS